MRYYLFTFLLTMSMSVYAGKMIDEVLPVTADGKVSISIVRGDVKISTWDRSEVRVTGELDEATDKFIFESAGSETSIKVELNDGSFNRNWHSDDSELTVYMPKNSSLECGGVSTDFSISGVQGGVTANSVSGDIDLNKVTKSLNIETVSGDIMVTDTQGKMKLASVSGDIDARGKAPTFKGTTVSGDIEASIGNTESVDLSTVSGDLEIDFELAEDGEVEAGTVSGDVTLNFKNKPVNGRFNLETGPGGDIRNKLTEDRPDSSFIGAEDVKFKSGNGKGTVEIETMSGTITVQN